MTAGECNTDIHLCTISNLGSGVVTNVSKRHSVGDNAGNIANVSPAVNAGDNKGDSAAFNAALSVIFSEDMMVGVTTLVNIGVIAG